MQGERILIPMYRNESDHMGPTAQAPVPPTRGGRPVGAGQPRPAAPGPRPWDCCGVVRGLLPESQ